MLKVITWNCNMAFRKKAHLLLPFQPDILIIQECEHIDKIGFSDGFFRLTDARWFGTNPNKGLGIFSFGKYRLKLRRTHNPDLKLIVPFLVSGGESDLDLYAIWANNPDDPDGQYVEQVWKALQHYRLKRKRTLLAGDFNSNTIWDRKYRVGNHSHVVEHLAKKGINSCYHIHHGQSQGSEAHPTFYLYKHLDKPYHLDYCFASADLSERIHSVEVGKFDDWMKYSDHVPVMVLFDD